ncbi:MAG TPA: MOSC domain-containing protein, partial [Hellea balneolensis]|nr:MOSC domain-containing protein [Hellea balneolensis]
TDVQSTTLKTRGLSHDRRYMVVDQTGRFVSQRECPKLATLTPRIDGNQLWIEGHRVEHAPAHKRKNVQIWKSEVSARQCDKTTNDWLDHILGGAYQLVYMDEQTTRLTSATWVPNQDEVSFADGYPVLVTTTASLMALNDHIQNTGGEAVPMRRFRPNLVIETDEPWAEDSWKSLQIGDVVLDLVKPCARCIVTTLDQSSGVKHGREPLQALRALRTSTDPDAPGVMFGWNGVARSLGGIHMGDRVRVLQTRTFRL